MKVKEILIQNQELKEQVERLMSEIAFLESHLMDAKEELKKGNQDD